MVWQRRKKKILGSRLDISDSCRRGVEGERKKGPAEVPGTTISIRYHASALRLSNQITNAFSIHVYEFGQESESV